MDRSRELSGLEGSGASLKKLLTRSLGVGSVETYGGRMQVEITGVCPSCGNAEHYGQQRNAAIAYMCGRCWTAFTREKDSLLNFAELDRRQNTTLEGLQQITKILQAMRRDLK